MTSHSRGRSFEDVVYELLTKELEAGRLGLLPSACTIHRRKRYFSRLRSTSIEVDISIEVTLPECKEWSFLWVWECKDYEDAVPVSDIEEFWAKLQQIGGVNIKGFVVTTGRYKKVPYTLRNRWD